MLKSTVAQIGCRLFFSWLRQPQRARLCVLYLGSAESQPASASSHSSSAWQGSLWSFRKILFIKKGGGSLTGTIVEDVWRIWEVS